MPIIDMKHRAWLILLNRAFQFWAFSRVEAEKWQLGLQEKRLGIMFHRRAVAL
jgi:hypothetical protein